MNLFVFVYGTLKRGGHNHARCCAGVRSVAEATVRGRLYRLSPQIPMLAIPAETVLAEGTADATRDVFEQARALEWNDTPARPELGWLDVRGELMEFDDPAPRLARLDALEQFVPASRRSWYRRVLVAVRRANGAPVAAWVYVAPEWTDLATLEPAPDPCCWYLGRREESDAGS